MLGRLQKFDVLNNYTHLQYDITLLSSSIKCFK